MNITNNINLLLKGCIHKNKLSQLKLFKQYYKSVHNQVSYYFGNNCNTDVTIDDICQQVFIEVFNSLTSFKKLSSFDTWIYRITTKVCINQLRKRYQKRQIFYRYFKHDNEFKDNDTPHSLLEEAELSDKIENSIKSLTEEKRTAMYMYDYSNSTLKNIAKQIHKPIGTVKSRLYFARREMKEKLKQYIKV